MGEKAPALDSAVRALTRRFREAGLETPQLDARILAAEACGLSPGEAIVKHDMTLSAATAQRMAGFAARRIAGEPVSRIIGRREFWGLSFKISPDTLDPRPETELLAETVLDYAKAEGLSGTPLRILDAGTGSGCLLAAVLSELPLAWGTGLDLSLPALEVARKNLSQLGLLDRSAFLCADWASAVCDGSFDIIVCNPPYIASSEMAGLDVEVKAFDPQLALDGGESGLEAYRLILPQAFKSLRDRGLLVFETGYRQAKAVRDIMAQSAPGGSLVEARILTDLSGLERAVAGVRQS
ncbi:MAG: peptide chain release factor N(5)-glutamine methyltransferase [Rhodomicrobium sp.]|nr:peptide chain release factor N(5)-glutamine methyltransferase [Rhodomicrobium sp.]